jgi:hypothetical protein
MQTVDLPLVEDEENTPWGYDVVLLNEWMQKHGKLEAWEKWSRGNTCAVINGIAVVYPWDVYDFLAGLPNLD